MQIDTTTTAAVRSLQHIHKELAAIGVRYYPDDQGVDWWTVDGHGRAYPDLSSALVARVAQGYQRESDLPGWFPPEMLPGCERWNWGQWIAGDHQDQLPPV